MAVDPASNGRLPSATSSFPAPIIELSVTGVGGSRGVLLPAEVLRRHGVGGTLIMGQRSGEIVLRPKRAPHQKLNWSETYREMAQADRDWSEWESMPTLSVTSSRQRQGAAAG